MDDIAASWMAAFIPIVTLGLLWIARSSGALAAAFWLSGIQHPCFFDTIIEISDTQYICLCCVAAEKCQARALWLVDHLLASALGSASSGAAEVEKSYLPTGVMPQRQAWGDFVVSLCMHFL